MATDIPVSELEALDRAIERMGGIGKFAAHFGITYQAVQAWRKEGRKHATPAEYCPTIERLSGVPCEELRPDVDWSVLRAPEATQ